MEEPALGVALGLATLWGLLCGLYVSFSILKATKRHVKADLRRAKRIYVDVDAQIINKTQLLCRVTMNNQKVLMFYVTSDSPLHYSVRDVNNQIPVDEQQQHTTVQ